MRLTARAREIISNADLEARKLGESFLKTEHLLLAFALYDNRGPALDDAFFWATYQLRINPERVLALIGKEYQSAVVIPAEEHLPFSPNFKKVLQYALEESRSMGYLEEITSEHLFLGIIRNKTCTASTILAAMNISLAEVRETVIYLLGEMDQLPERLLERHKEIPNGDRALSTGGEKSPG